MDRRRRHRQPSAISEHNELMSNPPRFSRFDDKAGYNGRSPSAAVLQSASVAVMEGMEHWYHRQQQLVDGRNLGLDDSHKVTKGIRVMNSKVFHGVHTVLNEHSQVVMQVRGGEVCIMLHFVETDTRRVPGVTSCVVHSRLISTWGTGNFSNIPSPALPSPPPPRFWPACLYPSFYRL